MFYEAQANVNHNDLNIKRGQSIKKDVFDKLPDRLKIKFKARKEDADVKPMGYNEIVGDTPDEKEHRKKVEDEENNSNDSKSDDESDEKDKSNTKKTPTRKK